jgi:hypothetical protein
MTTCIAGFVCAVLEQIQRACAGGDRWSCRISRWPLQEPMAAAEPLS